VVEGQWKSDLLAAEDSSLVGIITTLREPNRRRYEDG